MTRTDKIFESIILELQDPPEGPRGDPEIERHHVIAAKERRYQAFEKLQKDYLRKANSVAKRAYKLAGPMHPVYKKIAKLAQQVMWDENQFQKIMSESTTVIESIMEGLFDDDDGLNFSGPSLPSSPEYHIKKEFGIDPITNTPEYDEFHKSKPSVKYKEPKPFSDWSDEAKAGWEKTQNAKHKQAEIRDKLENDYVRKLGPIKRKIYLMHKDLSTQGDFPYPKKYKEIYDLSWKAARDEELYNKIMNGEVFVEGIMEDDDTVVDMMQWKKKREPTPEEPESDQKSYNEGLHNEIRSDLVVLSKLDGLMRERRYGEAYSLIDDWAKLKRKRLVDVQP